MLGFEENGLYVLYFLRLDLPTLLSMSLPAGGGRQVMVTFTNNAPASVHVRLFGSKSTDSVDGSESVQNVLGGPALVEARVKGFVSIHHLCKWMKESCVCSWQDSLTRTAFLY